MHLVVIEDDFHEKQWVTEELKRRFSSVTITEFKTIGDFLLALSALPTADVIITEHFLPLGGVGLEYSEEWFGKLDAHFPEVTADWNYQEAGERLVRHMRKIGVQTPVIIYTHSYEQCLEADVLKYPLVLYCSKDVELDNLIVHIQKFLGVKK